MPRLTWRQVTASGRVLREQGMMPGEPGPGLPLLIRVVAAATYAPDGDAPHGRVVIDWMPADGGGPVFEHTAEPGRIQAIANAADYGIP